MVRNTTRGVLSLPPLLLLLLLLTACLTGCVVGQDGSGAPPLHGLFPGPMFTVEMDITRFAPNPANDTSVNTTVAATMAVDEAARTSYLRVSRLNGMFATATWTDGVRNTSVVTVQSLCVTSPRAKMQDQVVTNLFACSQAAGLAQFHGIVQFQGHPARQYNMSSAFFYTAVNASNTPVGLWDGKGNIYTFRAWQPNQPAPTAPTKACHAVQTNVKHGRPAWWTAAAAQAGVLAQDGGVTMMHGKDAYWMFGDTFLKRETNPCTWSGISNTAMHVVPNMDRRSRTRLSSTPGGDNVTAKYYTGTVQDDNGCAWFFADVTKEQWNGPRKRHIWPGGGTNMNATTAVAWVQVVDQVNPGYAVAVSDVSGPPSYSLIGATPEGNFTHFPVFNPNVLQYQPDADGFVYLIDFVVPDGYSAWNRYGRLARVQVAHATSPEAYEFWDGGYRVAQPLPHASNNNGATTPPVVATFVTQQDMHPIKSPPLLYNVNNPQSSSTFLHALGMYAVFTADTTEEICVRLSPWPTGPWSAHIPVHNHERANDRPGVFIYAPYVHPELQPTPTSPSVTLTFSRNGGGCNFPTPCNDWIMDVSFPLATQ